MAGKLPEHRERYYCDLFRTTVLFWPSSYGKILVLLDEESEEDHVFGDKILDQTKKYFPDYKLEVQYEALPKEKSTLDFPGMPQPPGYNRQLWSSFFMDLFTNDSIIAWMDNDAAFITPVTKSMIFTGTKLRNLGSGCTQHRSWVPTWAETTELALGLPFVTDFMTYFPVYIYRDTFTRCREHILKRFNTSNFEEAFREFYKGYISPVSIIMGYAWYFERDRYDWNFEICNGLSEYNKRFANGHNTIGPEDVETILSEPQATFHVPYAEFLSSNILVSYCLSQKAAGNDLDICSSRSMSLSDNFVLLNFDLQFAFRKFYKGYLSPVSIIMGYAWYFERDRYNWNFEICNGLSEYNKRFANGHNTIGPEDVETILSEPQATFHVPYAEYLSSNILVSYCLSQNAAGNDLDICSSRSMSLSDNFVLLNFDLQFVETVDETPCTGKHTSTCLRVLERHYKQIGSEIKKGREVEWRNVETVEKLANEFDIQCSSLT
ncbi:unnamed protein product [Porites lobata]|uniref:Uncharacterized protein n=1 Tax=Porites lobata TaxID=104759 RepID=A0ABN8QGJ3_9CNID|nr:unnamed protein product [Porites lobata]